jgi:hypothetical protein
MECAAHLDIMAAMRLVDADRYRRGIELLERVVSMLTKDVRSVMVLVDAVVRANVAVAVAVNPHDDAHAHLHGGAPARRVVSSNASCRAPGLSSSCR